MDWPIGARESCENTTAMWSRICVSIVDRSNDVSCSETCFRRASSDSRIDGFPYDPFTSTLSTSPSPIRLISARMADLSNSICAVCRQPMPR